MIKLVIFDLDDTLYPEIEFVRSGFRAVAKAISRDFSFDPDDIYILLLKAFEENRKFVFNRVLEFLKIYNEEYLNKLICIYRTHKPEIHLYKDAEEMLPLLKNRFLLGLITDGFPSTQRIKVRALNIESYFDKIIYTEEKGENYKKPSLFPFIDMLSEFRIPPNDAVYIGDNVEKDFKGPKELGMITIKVVRDGIYKNSVPPGKSFEPDYIINSLFEIDNLLLKI
jgi:putative hydrolase of the HAD superfamily